MMPPAVLRYLAARFDQPLSTLNLSRTGGGCINHTFVLTLAGGKNVFCKLNAATRFPKMFEKEAAGLLLLGRQQAIGVPEVIDFALVEDHQVLLLEYVAPGPRTAAFWERFGAQLARLHTATAGTFGGDEDNFMGSVPQSNKKENAWIPFFTGQRLQPLAEACLRKGLLATGHLKKLERLYERLPGIFEPGVPSLVHGDLWSGNFLCNESSDPVLIDPAVYYGHPSVDLAMTTLFGGFDPRFYQAYHYHAPFPPNYEEQWAVCNLYPLLIHLFLFGTSYRIQIEQTLDAFA